MPRSSRQDNHNQLGEDMGKYQVVEPGDIVFNKLRTWQGGLGVSEYEGIVSPAYFVCRPRSDFSARFLHYLLLSAPYLQELTRVSKWQPPSQFDITWEQLRQVPIVAPRLSMQEAIADYLDTEMTRIDTLIDKKQRVIALLSERTESMIFKAVTQGFRRARALRPSGLKWISDIPVNWGTPTVSANFDLQLGKMLNAAAAEGPDQYPYLRNTNVQWDRFDLEDLATMHFSPSDRVKCELRSGDVLVCEGGEVGRAAVWGNELAECYYQKAIHRLRPRNGASGRYLMYCLRAAAGRSVFAVEGNTSTIVHLTGEQLAVHRFPWPDAEEQEEIVGRLDHAMSVTSSLVERLTGQIQLMLEHRQALITAAVTGQIDIPEVAA